MNGKIISILMQASTISVLFVVLLVVFFIALIAMTIALLASRSDKSDDDYDEDEDEDYDEDYDKKKSDKVKLTGKRTSSDDKRASHKDQDNVDIGSIFAEADKEVGTDSAFTDSALNDSAFSDSAFTDSAFSDSTTKNEADVVDTYAENSTDKDLYEEENDDNDNDEYDDVYDEVGDTDELIATDEQREFIEQLKKRDAEENVDNAAADDIFGDSAFSDSTFTDSAFPEQNISEFKMSDLISSEDIDASVKEAVALGKAMSVSSGYSQTAKGAQTGRRKKTNVPITDNFYWFNKLDVEEKPDYKTKEMYYHYFNVPEDCIEDLLIEMYDCALVRTEEIRYIAYGIEPRTISMKEIMGNGSNRHNQKKLKEPNAEDLLKIYAKWCSYVDELFEKVEIHADDYTTEKIRTLLCEFGRSDVDEILEGK
ncbi:MAG: hypothetical protein NC428_05520 [Clostridium sp.]|nr:hypothetical protein [Clostridium sp.]